MSRLGIAVIGVGSVFLSAIVAIIIGVVFLHGNPRGAPLDQIIWQWINVCGFAPRVAFHLDAVSLVFVFVITFVGALIHLYSAPFMWKEGGYARFFCYMNLFVGFMLVLVLADNLLLLYLGWEGVGLCSYLLIGFWYTDAANGYAARKAFTVTRIGDTAMVIGLFLLFKNFHTFDIQTIMRLAPGRWTVGSGVAVATALLLLGGAIGKSAQFPLQTWLPDAMAGPSPVSALIHAATMVTAGVYLIARTHALFSLAPIVQSTVAIIGAVTLVIGGMAALNQHDIKKVLAYSTISQIGYMFLALGVGAWSAAIFHFMIHAFFKALLFLSAGSVIWVMRDEHNMFKMGGLWRKLPVVFWTFLVGACALSALPLITAGFYSKDEILWLSFASVRGSPVLWIAGLVGAFLTALYTFRMVFLIFFGKSKAEPTGRPGLAMNLPLIILAALALFGGFIQLPDNMGHITLFSDLMEKMLPVTAMRVVGLSAELMAQVVAGGLAIGGFLVAYRVYYNKSFPAGIPVRNGWETFFYEGWGFDRLYNAVIVAPVVYLSRIDKADMIDAFYTGLGSLTGMLNKALTATQNGRLRWYAMALALGAILTLTILFYP